MKDQVKADRSAGVAGGSIRVPVRVPETSRGSSTTFVDKFFLLQQLRLKLAACMAWYCRQYSAFLSIQGQFQACFDCVKQQKPRNRADEATDELMAVVVSAEIALKFCRTNAVELAAVEHNTTLAYVTAWLHQTATPQLLLSCSSSRVEFACTHHVNAHASAVQCSTSIQHPHPAHTDLFALISCVCADPAAAAPLEASQASQPGSHRGLPAPEPC